MAEVVLDGVTKVFPGRGVAVQKFDLWVADKELLVLVGPSGCGKSTTLRMIAGLEEVTEGAIRIGGRVANDVAPRDRDVAMVFQNYALYPHMTVYRNLAFGLKLRYHRSLLKRLFWRLFMPQRYAQYREQRRGIDTRVRDVARTLGISSLLWRKPRQLSGGQRQRVALGRAMVREPAVFLLDEPLSNLDAPMRAEMRKELNELHRRLNATMVYVTHDQMEALTLGQRVAVMDRGTLQQVGTPLEVYEQPRSRFVAGFIGSPPMNFVEGRLVKVDESVAFEAPELQVPLPPEKLRQARGDQAEVTLGIRPEHVHLEEKADGASGAGAAGRVRVVEPLGSEMVVYVKVGPHELASNTDAHRPLRAGQAVSIRFDTRRLHLFDPQSGRNLTLANGWSMG